MRRIFYDNNSSFCKYFCAELIHLLRYKMKNLALLFLLLIFCASSAVETADDSSHSNDYEIARAIRQAVRDADHELLNSSLIGAWRNYLKLVAMDMNLQTQPLILIRFDEDANFRTQFKKIIEWQISLERKETRNFIYYYDRESPIPEVILGVQDAHFEEITKLFSINIDEKLPYRYDLTEKQDRFYPLEDLRGGVVSANPFALEKAAQVIFSYVNSQVPCITQPLSKIYGDYFENPATSKAYYEKCLEEIKLHGYYSMADLFAHKEGLVESEQEWFSAYAFVYLLDQNYKPQEITKFLESVNSEMTKFEVISIFEQTFGKTLAEVELNNAFQQHVKKL